MGRTRQSRKNSPARRRKTIPPASAEAALRREHNTKRRGELAELAFTLKAASLGFGVSKPYGDSERYDCILDARNLDRNLDSRNIDAGNLNCPSAAPLLPLVIPSAAGRGAKRPGLRSRGTPVSPTLQETHQGVSTTASIQPPLRDEASAVPATLHRIQIKCSTQLIAGLYRVNAHRRIYGRAVPYQLSEIDFIVAYIIPEDSWFIIPLAAILGRTSLLFRRKQDPKPGQYNQYREAWHLLRPKV